MKAKKPPLVSELGSYACAALGAGMASNRFFGPVFEKLVRGSLALDSFAPPNLHVSVQIGRVRNHYR